MENLLISEEAMSEMASYLEGGAEQSVYLQWMFETKEKKATNIVKSADPNSLARVVTMS